MTPVTLMNKIMAVMKPPRKAIGSIIFLIIRNRNPNVRVTAPEARQQTETINLVPHNEMQKVALKGFKVIRKLTGREQDFSNAIKGFMWVWIK